MKKRYDIPIELGVKLARYWGKNHPDDADECATWGCVTCPSYTAVIDWLESKHIYFEICPITLPNDNGEDEVKYYICVYGDLKQLSLSEYEYCTPMMNNRFDALDTAITYVIDNILSK